MPRSDRRYSAAVRNSSVRARNLFGFCHSFVIGHSSFVIFLTRKIDIVQPERP
jgi:hypothetical protein